MGACGTEQAAKLLLETVTISNNTEMNLRKGNLDVLMALLVSDVMLGCNYHGSPFQGSENGLGATILVADGGCSYRRLVKGEGRSGWRLDIIYSKAQGKTPVLARRAARFL